MKKTLATIATVLAVLVASIAPAAAAHGRGDLTIGLNGANEVGVEGDKNGSGKIELSFFAAVDNPTVVFPNSAYVCYELSFRNIDDPTMLHIHEVAGNTDNPRKDTGGVVVNLMPAKENIRMEGDATCVAMSSEVLAGILEDPSEYYVNLHNDAHPGGAIRGQLHAFS